MALVSLWRSSQLPLNFITEVKTRSEQAKFTKIDHNVLSCVQNKKKAFQFELVQRCL